MGETLTVRSGATVKVRLVAVDPAGANNSPYKFFNPALVQVGLRERLNEPSVRAIDFITGEVGEMFTPADEEYFDPLAPETTAIAASFSYDHGDATPASRRSNPRDVKVVAQFNLRPTADTYVRARGSNIPAGTMNVTDVDGNPLPDNLNDNIPCTDAACPPHVGGILTADVEAWANLMFHTNPIFIEIAD